MNEHAINQESRGLETLLQSLDADRERAGKKYVDIRSTLIKFFQRNDCPAAEDLSDRTLDRVAKILQRKKVDEVVPFIVGVGKNILREFWKRPAIGGFKSEVYELCCPSHELTLDSRSRYASLIRCVERLEAGDRELFREYFMSFGDDISRMELAERRRRLAQRFGLTPGALRVKAHRLRSEVKRCCLRCLLTKSIHNTLERGEVVDHLRQQFFNKFSCTEEPLPNHYMNVGGIHRLLPTKRTAKLRPLRRKDSCAEQEELWN